MGSLLMVMQTIFKSIIFLFVKQIFEILPKHNLLPSLPQRDQKTPGVI